MSAVVAKFLPRELSGSMASIDAFVVTALFSGIGLLLSLAVVLLDQQIPGEWF